MQIVRALSVLLAFWVAVAGCSPEPVPGAEGVSTSADPTAVAPADPTEPVAPAQTIGTEERGDNNCGFGQQLDPVGVEVTQIPVTPREDTRSALADMGDPAFVEPLVDPAEISTLLGPDGIPAIDEPRFQTVASVDWLGCTEPVMVVEVDGDARAYPLQIMTWHEIVNDTFGPVPVTVAYCPLCNSGLAYRRDLGERVLSFGTSGRLYNSSLIMYDRQTESLWTHFEGQAVIGELTGVQLERLPVQIMSLADFARAHPSGLVLTTETGHSRDYGRNPYPGYGTIADDPFAFTGDLDRRMAPKQRVLTLEFDGETVAIAHERIVQAETLALVGENTRLTVWHLPGTTSALDAGRISDGSDVGAIGVFVAPAGETYRRSGEVFIAQSTGQAYDISGQPAVGGDGVTLERVEHLNTFWFAIAAFDPEVRIFDR